MSDASPRSARGEYRIYGEIGAGGMASVHLARFLGTAGFARTVAIKRPLPNLQENHDFRQLARREALLAARVQHPNVVATLDVIDAQPDLLIVMEYVHGATLSTLARLARERGERAPLDIVVALLGGVLRGLSAVHQARSERGEPLGLVHRDVSPQNILCGVDGVARLADFGLAKASGQMALSNADEFKGKLTYAAPEQVELRPLTYAADLYAVGVVLWELVTGERMYHERTAPELVAQLLQGKVMPPSQCAPDVPAALEAVILHALARDPAQRPGSALAMAAALEESVRPASLEATAHWVTTLAGEVLEARARCVTEAESETTPSQRQPALAAAEPDVSRSEPETAAVSTARAEPERSPRRDLAPRPASPGAGARWKLLLPLGGLMLGVALTWFAGQLLWPSAPPQGPALPEAREALSAAAPAVAPPVSPGVVAAPTTPPPAVADATAESEGGGVGGTGAALERSAAQGAERLRAAARARAPEPRALGGASTPARASGGAGGSGRDCQPPYSLDAEGIRHMKPGCE